MFVVLNTKERHLEADARPWRSLASFTHHARPCTGCRGHSCRMATHIYCTLSVLAPSAALAERQRNEEVKCHCPSSMCPGDNAEREERGTLMIYLALWQLRQCKPWSLEPVLRSATTEGNRQCCGLTQQMSEGEQGLPVTSDLRRLHRNFSPGPETGEHSRQTSGEMHH